MRDPLFQALCGRATADATLDGRSLWGLEQRASEEGVEGLLYYTAIAAGWPLSDDLNWDAIEDKARRYGLLRPLVYGLNALEGLNPGQLPDRAAAQQRRVSLGAVEKRLLRRLLRERPHSEWGQVLWAFNCRGLWRRAAFLAEYLFPRPAVLLQASASSRIHGHPGLCAQTGADRRTIGRSRCLGGEATAVVSPVTE